MTAGTVLRPSTIFVGVKISGGDFEPRDGPVLGDPTICLSLLEVAVEFPYGFLMCPEVGNGS